MFVQKLVSPVPKFTRDYFHNIQWIKIPNIVHNFIKLSIPNSTNFHPIWHSIFGENCAYKSVTDRLTGIYTDKKKKTIYLPTEVGADDYSFLLSLFD